MEVDVIHVVTVHLVHVGLLRPLLVILRRPICIVGLPRLHVICAWQKARVRAYKEQGHFFVVPST